MSALATKNRCEASIKGCKGCSVEETFHFESEDSDFLARHTLLQACYHVASVLETVRQFKHGVPCVSALAKKEWI